MSRFDFDAPRIAGNPKIESYVSQIDLATGASLTTAVKIVTSEYGVAEGCHLLKRDGYYYLFTAEGGTQDGHRECVYRSQSPYGPFGPPPDGINPVIYNHDHPDIQNTGHMDLIDGDDGKWVAVFLGVRPCFGQTIADNGSRGMPSHLGREAFMAPMEWIDGWPVVNKRQPIELIGSMEGLDLKGGPSEWVDNFDSDSEFHTPMNEADPALDIGWYSARTPLRPFHSLTARAGHLGLRGGAHKLTTEHVSSMLLRKQTSFECDWSTRMRFEPSSEGEEAGAIVYLSAASHAIVAVRGLKDGLQVVFRCPDGNGDWKVSGMGLDLRAGD